PDVAVLHRLEGSILHVLHDRFAPVATDDRDLGQCVKTDVIDVVPVHRGFRVFQRALEKQHRQSPLRKNSATSVSRSSARAGVAGEAWCVAAAKLEVEVPYELSTRVVLADSVC